MEKEIKKFNIKKALILSTIFIAILALATTIVHDILIYFLNIRCVNRVVCFKKVIDPIPITFLKIFIPLIIVSYILIILIFIKTKKESKEEIKEN